MAGQVKKAKLYTGRGVKDIEVEVEPAKAEQPRKVVPKKTESKGEK